MLLDMARPRGNQAPRPGGKLSTSFRLSSETLDRIERLAEELHIKKAEVVEMAVRALAKREKVE
jgi:predicted transcriptional regulator